MLDYDNVKPGVEVRPKIKHEVDTKNKSSQASLIFDVITVEIKITKVLTVEIKKKILFLFL